jgi:hypothetical protein
VTDPWGWAQHVDQDEIYRPRMRARLFFGSIGAYMGLFVVDLAVTDPPKSDDLPWVIAVLVYVAVLVWVAMRMAAARLTVDQRGLTSRNRFGTVEARWDDIRRFHIGRPEGRVGRADRLSAFGDIRFENRMWIELKDGRALPLFVKESQTVVGSRSGPTRSTELLARLQAR